MADDPRDPGDAGLAALVDALLRGGRADGAAAAAAGVPPAARWVGLTLLAAEGALAELAVCAGFRPGADGGASQPLALPPRRAAWSAMAADAPGGAAALWSDAAFATARDLPTPRCGAYVAAAAPVAGAGLPARGTVLAVVLGFDSDAAARGGAPAAAALAARAARACAADVAASLSVLESLLAPAPPPRARRAAAASAAASDAAASDAAADAADAAAGAADAAARAAHGRMAPLTLRFADATLERRFLRWRDAQMAFLDLTSCLLNHVFLAYLLFAPGAFHLSAKLDRVGASLPALLARSELALAPQWLLLSRAARPWYLARREALTAYVFLGSLAYHAWLGHYVGLVDDAVMRSVQWNHGSSWIGVVQCMYAPRFALAAPLNAAVAAADAALSLPRVCAAHYAAEAPARCAARLFLRALPFSTVLPLAAMYALELKARRLFLARRAAAAAGAR